MLINQDYLRFMKIYEELSLSKAAEKLDVYQGALSKLLKKLEGNLGENLFIRTNRGLVATEFSKDLYLQVKKQSILWTNFSKEVDAKELTGLIRFGGHPILLNQFDINFANLLNKFNQLELKFSFNRSATVTRSILNFDLEFGIVLKPKKFDDLVLKQIDSDQIGMFSPTKKFNNKTIIYNPELLEKDTLAKKVPKGTRLLANPNLSLSISIAKKLNCAIVTPKKIANNFGFKNQIGTNFSSSKVYLIYRAEQKLNFNTQLITNAF